MNFLLITARHGQVSWRHLTHGSLWRVYTRRWHRVQVECLVSVHSSGFVVEKEICSIYLHASQSKTSKISPWWYSLELAGFISLYCCTKLHFPIMKCVNSIFVLPSDDLFRCFWRFQLQWHKAMIKNTFWFYWSQTSSKYCAWFFSVHYEVKNICKNIWLIVVSSVQESHV